MNVKKPSNAFLAKFTAVSFVAAALMPVAPALLASAPVIGASAAAATTSIVAPATTIASGAGLVAGSTAAVDTFKPFDENTPVPTAGIPVFEFNAFNPYEKAQLNLFKDGFNCGYGYNVLQRNLKKELYQPLDEVCTPLNIHTNDFAQLSELGVNIFTAGVGANDGWSSACIGKELAQGIDGVRNKTFRFAPEKVNQAIGFMGVGMDTAADLCHMKDSNLHKGARTAVQGAQSLMNNAITFAIAGERMFENST